MHIYIYIYTYIYIYIYIYILVSRRSPLIPTLPHVVGAFLLTPSLGLAEALFSPNRNCSTGNGLFWQNQKQRLTSGTWEPGCRILNTSADFLEKDRGPGVVRRSPWKCYTGQQKQGSRRYAKKEGCWVRVVNYQQVKTRGPDVIPRSPWKCCTGQRRQGSP